MSSREEYKYLVDVDVYRAAKVHIGGERLRPQFRKFVTTRMMRKDPFGKRIRTRIIDLKQTDYRIRLLSDRIARVGPENVAAFCSKQACFNPIMHFSRLTGAKAYPGRFVPGMLTNPQHTMYIEPELVIVTDPLVDKQAILEAASMGIPIAGILTTDNPVVYIDFIVPANNRLRDSLALVYRLITREVLLKTGVIASREDMPVKREEFTKRPKR